MRIRDSVAIVTGASQGIGRETAILLAGKGAKVWAAARSEDKLKQLAADHAGIEAFACDVANDEDRAALVAAAGEVDILVNNAGLGWMGLIETMPTEQVRKLFEVNVLGLIDLTQRVLPGMIERRHGHIANVSSIAGYISMPPLSVYSATKFAVNGFTDGLRRELVGRGVSVSLINPGPIDTGFTERAIKEDQGSIAEKGGLGIPAWVTANTIYRSIRLSGLPGYTTMSSPRLMGLSRLGEIPGLALLLDAAAVASRAVDFRRRSD